MVAFTWRRYEKIMNLSIFSQFFFIFFYLYDKATLMNASIARVTQSNCKTPKQLVLVLFGCF